MQKLAIFVGVAASGLVFAQARGRTWTDNTGAYQVKAEYVGFAEGEVKLKKGDGSVVEIPLERLSAADRVFVRRQRTPEARRESRVGARRDDLQKELILSFAQPFGVFPPSGAEPLFATIELDGAAVKEATHFGFLKVTSATTGDGSKLQQIENSFGMDNPVNQFVQVDRQMMFAGQFEKPEDRLRMHLMLEPPPAGAERLRILEGEVQLMVGERRQLTIDDIASRIGEELSEPLLTDSGVEIRVVEPAQANAIIPNAKPEQVVSLIIQGEKTAILEMGLVNAQGDELKTSMSWSGGDDGPTRYTLQTEQPLPADAGFRLSLAVEQKRLKVPFRFEDVGLPAGEGSTTAIAVSVSVSGEDR